jgi:hypothetical protein
LPVPQPQSSVGAISQPPAKASAEITTEIK